MLANGRLTGLARIVWKQLSNVSSVSQTNSSLTNNFAMLTRTKLSATPMLPAEWRRCPAESAVTECSQVPRPSRQLGAITFSGPVAAVSRWVNVNVSNVNQTSCPFAVPNSVPAELMADNCVNRASVGRSSQELIAFAVKSRRSRSEVMKPGGERWQIRSPSCSVWSVKGLNGQHAPWSSMWVELKAPAAISVHTVWGEKWQRPHLERRAWCTSKSLPMMEGSHLVYLWNLWKRWDTCRAL